MLQSPDGPSLDSAVGGSAFDLSPDGRLVVAAEEDGRVQLWDASLCRPLGAPEQVAEGVCDVRSDRDSRSFRTVRETVLSAVGLRRLTIWCPRPC
jgi:hypothetical protein